MSEIEMPIGTVVRLKSGGPKMTIVIYNIGKPVCQYFVNNKLEEFVTSKANLRVVNDDEE